MNLNCNPHDDNPYECLCRFSQQIVLNASDFFRYSEAYCINLDSEDLMWVIPIVEKYMFDGIAAVMAFIQKEMPIEKYQSECFKMAYSELEKETPLVWSERT